MCVGADETLRHPLLMTERERENRARDLSLNLFGAKRSHVVIVSGRFKSRLMAYVSATRLPRANAKVCGCDFCLLYAGRHSTRLYTYMFSTDGMETRGNAEE